METIAITCLHEPFYTTPQYVPLPLPQVLSFYYVQGSHLHMVVFTGTVLTRACNAPQHKLERRDARMAAQEHVALAWSLIDLFNHRHSDPAWLDKSLAAFAADCEVVDGASGTTFRGPEGYKRLMRFFVENFPDSWQAVSTEFATEDGVVLEGTWRWTTTGSRTLLNGALKASGRSGEVRCCIVMQIRKGKITSLHSYYDLTTLLEQFGLNAAAAEAT